jgi:5-hydroxyisourate hydrolase
MARLSTHVLDTSRGRPAADVAVDLHAWRDGERRHVTTSATDADGRIGQGVLSGDGLAAGVYELIFHAGDYFRALGLELAVPPFLDEVVIRFGIADAAGNFHVPLLLSPYGYSTYRGS